MVSQDPKVIVAMHDLFRNPRDSVREQRMSGVLERLVPEAKDLPSDRHSLSCARARRGVARQLDIEKWSHACISINQCPLSATGRIKDVLMALLSQYHD